MNNTINEINKLGAQLEEIKAKSCEARIGQELTDREKDLRDLFTIADDYEGDEDLRDQANEEIYEFAYGYETYKVTRLTWSGGGPADWIEVHHDGDGIRRIDYVFQDWYDGARREVPSSSPIWRYASIMLDGLEA
jgi:hypothetical protein